jgi:hypothetical protein
MNERLSRGERCFCILLVAFCLAAIAYTTVVEFHGWYTGFGRSAWSLEDYR